MSLRFRRDVPILLVYVSIFFVSCSRPSLPPIPFLGRQPNETPAVQVAETPLPLPSATPLAVPAARSLFESTGNPYIPNFGSFPPIPIPARPANINPLTGLAVEPALLQRRPLLVRIGNDTRVRENYWQVGTASADLVFEELIDQIGDQYINTRLTAVFLSKDAPLVGPVRSGRLINLQLVPMLDGAVAHAGASDGVRWIFSHTPVHDLDEYFNQPAYCYINPHGYIGRLYTTVPRLREWLVQKGLEQGVPLYGFAFSETAPGGASAHSIGINAAPWPKSAVVEWRYDSDHRHYVRYVSGDPLIDNSYSVKANWGNGADCVKASGESRVQVTAANVVVLYARHEATDIVEDANNAVSVYINLTGQGDADIFRDGVRLRGSWQRDSVQEFFRLTTSTGETISLKPGNTWFEVVPIGFDLDVK